MKRVAYLVPLAIAIALTGCALRETRAEPSDSATARVGIVNHTGSYIYSASVDGSAGGNMAAWGAASASVCCTSIPRVWYQGMKVRVRWNMPIGVQSVIKEKVVEVEKYDTIGDIYMNFFPNDEVRVVVSRNGPRAPDYPIPHLGKPTNRWMTYAVPAADALGGSYRLDYKLQAAPPMVFNFTFDVRDGALIWNHEGSELLFKKR